MLETGVESSTLNKRRVKTGCLNCREKHKKCDETKPVCGLCVKRHEHCNWPPPKDKITPNSFRIVKLAEKKRHSSPNIQDLLPRRFQQEKVQLQLLNQLNDASLDATTSSSYQNYYSQKSVPDKFQSQVQNQPDNQAQLPQFKFEPSKRRYSHPFPLEPYLSQPPHTQPPQPPLYEQAIHYPLVLGRRQDLPPFQNPLPSLDASPKNYQTGVLPKLDPKYSEADRLLLQHSRENSQSFDRLMALTSFNNQSNTTHPQLRNLMNIVNEGSFKAPEGKTSPYHNFQTPGNDTQKLKRETNENPNLASSTVSQENTSQLPNTLSTGDKLLNTLSPRQSSKIYSILSTSNPDSTVPDISKAQEDTNKNYNRGNSGIVEATEKNSSPQIKKTPEMSSHSGMGKASPTTPISSDSLMAPFLNYSHLHRTFRDYMFTNVANSSTIKYKDILESSFKDSMKNPDANLFKVPKNLKECSTLSPNASNSSDNFGIKKEEMPAALKDLLDDQRFLNLLVNDATIDINEQNHSSVQDVNVTDVDRLKLYKTYIYKIAPWLDIFDNSSKQFGSSIPNLATENMALLNSILALASRHLEKTDKTYSSKKTIKLYQDALKELIPTVNKTLNTPTIASCVILCVFQMMSSTPKKWRYHLEGCAALFKMHNINGFCDGPLERSIFWCFARMDLASVIMGEQSTIIPSEHLLLSSCTIYDLKQLFNKFDNKEDMYANYIFYLCSRVLNLISNAKLSYEKEWGFLWSEINDWYINRPSSFQPILTFNDAPFPGVLYVNGAPIAANQMYHMAIILLTQNKPRLHKIVYLDHVKSPIWHAKQICGISLHNENHGAWNCASQPLWVAGQLLSSDQEHEIVLSLLNRIETTTGWQMKFRIRDLQRHWNGEDDGENDTEDENDDDHSDYENDDK